MNQTKLWAFVGMMMLTSIFAVKTNAVNIPITSVSTNAAKTGTGSCVTGYFSGSWTTTASFFQYDLNTTTYSGVIAMDFATQRSATGPSTMQIWYSINGGAFQLLPVAQGGTFTVGTGCATKTATLPATCAGVANLRVKFQPTTPLPTNTAGTFRADSINVFDAASSGCVGTPAQGGSVNSVAVCSGNSTTLSLTGATAGAGIAYQWQSFNGSIWVDIAGATNLSYTTPAMTATTQYRVRVSCTSVGGGSVNSTAGTVTVNSLPVVAAITGYNAPLLVDGIDTLLNATAGGVWTSSNPSAVSVNLTSGIMTGEFGGTSVLSYSVTNGNGCTGVSSINVNVVWPNTLALYAGVNGNSTGVINVPGDQTQNAYKVGFGTATACGSGGISGMTVNVADSVFSTSGPRAGYFVYPDANKALNMYRIQARARVSATGPQKAVLGYRLWNNGVAGSWTTSTEVDLVDGNCGASANVWDFNSGFPENPNPTVFGITDSLEVAVFPFKPVASTGTFQLNMLEVYGIVTTDANCSNGSITTTADSVIPALSNICDSGSRFLTYNIGNGGVAGVNIFLQWEESTNGSTWNAIPGAEGVVYQTPMLVAGVAPPVNYYRVAVFCAASGTTQYSAVGVVNVNGAPSAGTLTTGIDSNALFPMEHMLIGSTYNMSSTVAGGTWSSNDTSSISIAGNVATPNLPGDAVITYRVVVNGCTGTSRQTVASYYPNTRALYIGKNGNSTAVYAASGVTATALASANWGTPVTPCGNGGISGLTNADVAKSDATNGRLSTTVTNTTGSPFAVNFIRATTRKTNTGTYKAYLGYRLLPSGPWVTAATATDVETDDCGYSHSVLSFATTGLNVAPGASYDFAIFGYNGSTTVGLQVNSLSVIGTGTQLINGAVSFAEGTDVQLYPNPATDVLNVRATQNVKVVIMSIEGKKLIEQNDAKSINVSTLVNGMYLIQVYGENNSLLKTQKFVKK